MNIYVNLYLTEWNQKMELIHLNTILHLDKFLLDDKGLLNKNAIVIQR